MNIQDLSDSLEYLTKAELTPFIWGHAGIGKTSVIKQYAEKKGYHFFPFYLGTMSDIGDILGLADFVRDESGKAIATKFATPEWLVNAISYCNENPDSGAIIFLDEFNRARRDILNGMFSLALDKTFHTIKLPRNCHIIAAGNPPTDEYFTTDVDETALMARFVHVKLEPSVDEWVSYARAAAINPSLIGFIREQPELLESARTDFTLPVKVDRRSYERLNRLMKLSAPSHLLEQLMTGIIGLERTVAYQKFLQESDKPLTAQEVLSGEKLNLVEKWSQPDSILSSLLNITCDNLKAWLTADSAPSSLNADEQANLMTFILTAPKDIVYPIVKTLVQDRNKPFRDFFLNPLHEQPMIDWMKQAKGIQQAAQS